MSENTPMIEIIRNGPIKVFDLTDLTNIDGEALPTKPRMSLCRCGRSKRKPKCDGTHLKIGFTDEKDPGRVPDKPDHYEGENLTVHDNRGVCSHRGNCTKNAPSVFNKEREPWVDPDGMDAEEALKVIETCPSGALSYTKDGVLHRNYDRKPGITVVSKGPYDVVGYIALKDDDGNKPESPEHYTLCRCGHSKNKPFCSGQHLYVKDLED